MGKRFKQESGNMNILKIAVIAAILILLIIIISTIWYSSSISPVNKNNDEEVEVIIPLGTGSSGIASILKENKIIKSETAFKIYLKLKGEKDFQAGTYYLKQSMKLKEITEMLKTGKMFDPNQINITYIEGKNIRWLANIIEEKTNNKQEDVYNLLGNEEYIDSLIEKYWFLTDEIKDENIYYPLEGYLFPDTYALENRDVPIEVIFEKMLNRMEEVLDGYIQNNKTTFRIDGEEYSIHEVLTIASVIECESMDKEGRKNVASVIYNRLDKGMAIQSDVTTYYGIKVEPYERDLYQKEINESNPYNTRGPSMGGKLPIGPISSVSKSSIEAALKPNETDYLFFVADKNGKLYFSKSNSEHDRIIQDLKDEGLWFEY